jgi:hypothetical protein
MKIAYQKLENAAGTKEVGEDYLVNGGGVARAWTTWDASSTPTIDQSLNTSSLTDIATGQQRSNFTSSFSAGDFASAADCQGVDNVASSQSVLAASVSVYTYYAHGTSYTDRSYVSVALHGDLA